MKHVRVALWGMVILMCLFCSCSFEKKASEEPEEPVITEKPAGEEEPGLAGDPAEEPAREPGNPDDTPDPSVPKEEIPAGKPPVPVFLGSRKVSEREIVFEFSLPVTTARLVLSPDVAHETVVKDSTVRVHLAEDPAPGQRFEADITAKDARGNTVNTTTFFYARNNRVPELRINELYTEQRIPDVEFIEFKILSPGNLGALRVFAVSNRNPLIYEFKPVEVEAGEYVVLHLRTQTSEEFPYKEEGYVDEYGTDLNESASLGSCDNARDFWLPWIPESEKLLQKTDAVYVLDQDDRVVDAVMIAENPAAPWGSYFDDIAGFLFAQDAWESAGGEIPGPADAVDTFGISPGKSISRYETAENTHTKADWYIAVTEGGKDDRVFGYTPGRANKLNTPPEP